MESYSSGRRGVTRNLVGHEKLPPGFKSPTLRSKLHDSASCSFCFKIDSKIGDIDENDRFKKTAQSDGKRRIG